VPNYPFNDEKSLRWTERACAQARVIAGSPRALGTAEAEYLLARLRRDEVIYVNGADGQGSIDIEKDEEVLTHAMTMFLSELFWQTYVSNEDLISERKYWEQDDKNGFST
jgi:hypothetical protein